VETIPHNQSIDNGTNAGCPSTDPRGKPRPHGLRCDIGTVEAAYLSLPLILN
jgi:hypothetical protein